MTALLTITYADYTSGDVHELADSCNDARQARHLWAITMVLDGDSRREAVMRFLLRPPALTGGYGPYVVPSRGLKRSTVYLSSANPWPNRWVRKVFSSLLGFRIARLLPKGG